MAWKIEFERAAERDLSKLNPEISKRVIKFLFTRVAFLDDPRSIGEAFVGKRFGEFWKYRVGDYRIICKIEDKTLTVIIVQVGHRSDVYN